MDRIAGMEGLFFVCSLFCLFSKNVLIMYTVRGRATKHLSFRNMLIGPTTLSNALVCVSC